ACGTADEISVDRRRHRTPHLGTESRLAGRRGLPFAHPCRQPSRLGRRSHCFPNRVRRLFLLPFFLCGRRAWFLYSALKCCARSELPARFRCFYSSSSASPTTRPERFRSPRLKGSWRSLRSSVQGFVPAFRSPSSLQACSNSSRSFNSSSRSLHQVDSMLPDSIPRTRCLLTAWDGTTWRNK